MVYILFIAITIISYLVQHSLQSKFKIYSQESLDVPLTGRDVAAKFLHDSGISNVNVTNVSGQLTDHYNPANGTVNLSDVVFSVNSVASAAVAAHECGHAVQHATAYQWLTMRSRMVPMVQFGSQWAQWILLAGIVLYGFSALVGRWVLLVGIVLFGLTTLFSVITLPVEYNASERAVAWLDQTGITSGKETTMAKDALKWAARTYLVAALSSLATLLYYLMIILGNRR